MARLPRGDALKGSLWHRPPVRACTVRRGERWRRPSGQVGEELQLPGLVGPSVFPEADGGRGVRGPGPEEKSGAGRQSSRRARNIRPVRGYGRADGCPMILSHIAVVTWVDGR